MCEFVSRTLVLSMACGTAVARMRRPILLPSQGGLPMPSDPARRRALDAATRVYLAREALDMSALASTLGVGRATLYRWVGNRDDLLGAVLGEATERTYREAIAREQADGNLQVTTSPEVLARALVRICDVHLYAPLLGGDEPEIETALELVALLLGSGEATCSTTNGSSVAAGADEVPRGGVTRYA